MMVPYFKATATMLPGTASRLPSNRHLQIPRLGEIAIYKISFLTFCRLPTNPNSHDGKMAIFSDPTHWHMLQSPRLQWEKKVQTPVGLAQKDRPSSPDEMQQLVTQNCSDLTSIIK
jgi:hypothetical protein